MRRVRPLLVLAAVAVLAAAALGGAAWVQRDFWSESAGSYLRERLAREYEVDFQAEGPRVRWLPPAVSLGRVTLHRRGEPWVLEAEDVRVSFNLYAILAGRERLGTVVLRRPRLFVRERAAAAPGASGAAGAAARDVGAPLLRLPLPFRILEVEGGRVHYRRAGGALVLAEEVDAVLEVSSDEARLRLAVARLAADLGGRREELGSLTAGGSVGEDGIEVDQLALEGDTVAARLSGRVSASGDLALGAAVTARLDRLGARLGLPALRGSARFTGTVAGRREAPEVDGSLALSSPAVGSVSLPSLAGPVAWRRGRLTWDRLAGAWAGGGVALSGSAEPGERPPRWSAVLEASGLEPARLPFPGADGLGRIRGVAGTVEVSGEGLAWPAVSGSAAAGLRARVEGWTAGEVAASVTAAFDGASLRIDGWRLAAEGITAGGEGAWTPAAGLALDIRGAVDDLSRLAPRSVLPLAGRVTLEARAEVGHGSRMLAGTVAVADGLVGPVRDITGAARASYGEGGLRLAEGRFTWAGGAGTVTGSIALPGKELTLAATLSPLALPEVVRVLGGDAGRVAGEVAATIAIRGTPAAPALTAQVRGGPLRFDTVEADAASLAVTWTPGRVEVGSLRLERGATVLHFRGAAADGQVSGVLESPSYDLRDLLPRSALDAAGTLSCRVDGPLRAPVVTGTIRATRLRAGMLDLRRGELGIEVREGAVALQGWVGSDVNRLRAVLEPGYDWRFEADLELGQFSPEMLGAGGSFLPPALARGFSRASFLASGRLHAAGRLLEPASIEADLRLDSLWLQAAGRTLQNLAPVRIGWRGEELRVEELRLAGDQYWLEVGGTAGPARGWALEGRGTLGLGLFQEYWDELLQISGTATVHLALRGPWGSPTPEGTIEIAEGFVRARSLPEPVEGLSGGVELQGRTIRASGLTGTIAGSPVRASGSYRFDEDRLDAEVDGRLDLALMRSRVPLARELRGPVEVRLRLAGPIAAPRFSGDVEVLGAEFYARPFPAKITDVRGALTLGSERIEVRELTGQTGGGTLRLAGALDWGAAAPRADFDLAGSGLLLALGRAAKVQTDVALGLHGTFDDLRLAGEVTIVKGRYNLEFDAPLPEIGAEEQGPPERGAPDLSRTRLAVRVRATDNIWITNETAKIEAALAIEIGGTLGAPRLSGEVTAIQGDAYYLSRYFRLESATLRFVPPATVPVLNLQASTAVGETQILFLMDGPLDDLTFNLTSLPPLSQEDIISLLTVGQTRENLERRGDEAAAVGAGVFASEPIVNALGDTARSSLGLEILQLEPIVGTDSQVSARLTLGTHLSDRLFVSYSQNLGENEDQQFRIEYSILDFLAVWGRQMRQGIYSLDLVFRYAFR